MPNPASVDTTSASTIRRVLVALGERSYDILIGPVLAEAGAHCAALSTHNSASRRNTLIVTDPAVASLYDDALTDSLANAGFSPSTIALSGGEQRKSLAAVEEIYDALYEMAADRRTLVIALGGGVVGDVAGFAAASYQRGLDFVQIPTTLLAQVDSSVGGKTGVNFRSAKNLIGAFHQPKLVLIDPIVLGTLPLNEHRSGLAEVVKYGAIADAELFHLLQREIASLLTLDSPYLSDVIARSCAIKAAIVESDERETSGARAALNFGHTVGHALEAVTGYSRYRHGEAIAIGMVTAALIGESVGRADPAVTRNIVELLRCAGFATAPDPSIATDKLLSLLALDKKSVSGEARFVLLDRLGSASSGHVVPLAVVRGALERQQLL